MMSSREEQSPCGNFHMVFDVPHALHPLILDNKKVLTRCLWVAVRDTVFASATDPHWCLEGKPGLLTILHTWSQTLIDHFHIHCLIPGERIIGWVTHFAIGITWAAFLLAIWGLDWARHPTPLPALLVGLVTVIAPLFIMQPAMVLGLAASKTPRPNAARLKSTHAVYGIGLYSCALFSAALIL